MLALDVGQAEHKGRSTHKWVVFAPLLALLSQTCSADSRHVDLQEKKVVGDKWGINKEQRLPTAVAALTSQGPFADSACQNEYFYSLAPVFAPSLCTHSRLRRNYNERGTKR